MTNEIAQLEQQIRELKQRLTQARRALPPTPVSHYTFTNPDHSVTDLASLFGDHADLLVIHNMGRRCVYCTLWADGFNGLASHLQNRAAFVLASPDDPETLSRFAAARGWTFRTVSTQNSPFGKDMGYEPKPGEVMPGVSAFHKAPDGRITRTGTATFGPGDDFCSVWPLFDLLEGGPEGWEPKYAY